MAALIASFAAASPQFPQNSPPPPPVTIVLPPKLVAGSRATLAVLDASGHLVSGAAVELSGFGEVKTDSTGRATFVAPAGTNSLYADFKNGGSPTMAPVSPSEAHNAGESIADARVINAPSVIAVGEPLDIEGSGLSGDASQNRVAIGDQSALVLAAAPSSIVALPSPNAALGDTQLSVVVQGKPIYVRPVTVVSLDLAGPANPLAAGATSKLVVRAAGSAKPVLVQVTNTTPDVIDLPGGNARRLVTSGGASNSIALPLVSIRPGDYAVSVRLLSPRPLPDEETAQLELMDARGIADMKWRKRLDDLLLLIKRQPKDLPRVRRGIAKELQERPPVRVEDSLRVALQLLALS